MFKKRGKAKEIWFRAKKYGWGWYPTSWQGWLSLGIFILAYVIVLIWLLKKKNLLEIILGILIILILLSVLFIICYKKGDALGWRWNGKLVKNRRNKK